MFTRVRDAAYQIIERKGATYYAIGLAATAITQAILRDENSVMTVSSLLAGEPYGITDVCLSTPSVLNRGGIRSILTLLRDAGSAKNLAACRATRSGRSPTVPWLGQRPARAGWVRVWQA